MCATISAGSTSSAITTSAASPLSINLVTSLVPFATYNSLNYNIRNYI